MKFIPSFGEFTIKGKLAFKRFPIVLSWVIIGTLFTLFAVEIDLLDTSFYTKAIITFILGVSWLIATRFLEEQLKRSGNWIFLITFLFLGFFYTTLLSEETMNTEQITRFVLYLLVGHLLVFVAPFVFLYEKNTYFNYLKCVFISIVRSLFFSLILYLGITLALLAIKYLFNVDIKSERFLQIFIFCLGIVNTWVYLSDFPMDIHSKTTINYTKALEVLVKYILIPLVVLYLIILYAYSLKIVINWSLPKGWVTHLILALSFLGFTIQLLISPIQKIIDSKVIKYFHPWFYVILLPLILLLFIAIFRRISDYGITENRYFVIVLACWILGMTLYMLFSKKKRTKWFPLSLAILSIAISFGFWGAFSVSTKSQIYQFEKKFNEIKAANLITTSKKKNRLESIVQYLNKKGETDKLSSVLGYNPKEVFKNEDSWSIPYKIINKLNIEVKDKEEDNLRFNFSQNDLNIELDVRNYDFLSRIHISEHETSKGIQGKYYFKIGKKSNVIKVIEDGKLIGEIDCSQLIKELLSQSQNYDISKELMTIEKNINNTIFKVVFINISLFKGDSKEKYLYTVNAYVLLKSGFEP